MNIKVIVICDNAHGQPDFVPYVVTLPNMDHYVTGEHYDMASHYAEKAGYTPMATADENDPLFKPFANFVDWAKLQPIVIRCER